jgi:hypothetical protein
MNTTPLIVLQIEIPVITLPRLEQFSAERQAELIQALAALLLRLPQLQAIEQMMTAPFTADPGASHE